MKRLVCFIIFFLFPFIGTYNCALLGLFWGFSSLSVEAVYSVKLTRTDKGQQKSLRQTKLEEMCLFPSLESLGTRHFTSLMSPILQLSARHFSLDFAALAGFCSLLLFSFVLSLFNTKVSPHL